MTTTRGNQSFVVRRTDIGLGLFALRPFAKGKRMLEYVGPVITSEEADRKGGMYLFEIDENHTVDGSARTNLARYINHSCRPNAEAFIYGKRIWIYSKRAIKAGEALTLNYGPKYFDEIIKPKGCKCEVCAGPKKKKAARKKAAAAAAAGGR
jgi:SET domain-containing protein